MILLYTIVYCGIFRLPLHNSETHFKLSRKIIYLLSLYTATRPRGHNSSLSKKSNLNEEKCECQYLHHNSPNSEANTWGYLSRGWSTEYHICYYISKCSSWSVVYKSSICHFGKSDITPIFKMASTTAASYRNDPWNNNACLNQILSITFCFQTPLSFSKCY